MAGPDGTARCDFRHDYGTKVPGGQAGGLLGTLFRPVPDLAWISTQPVRRKVQESS